MAEVVIDLKAKPNDSFDVLRRMGDEADKFGKRVNGVSQNLEGLRLKSEARVATNIGRIAESMTGGASAGDLLSQAIIRVSESFKGSLLFAGAATVGAALYEGITKAGDAAIKLQDDIDNLTRGAKVGADFLGISDINKNLTETLAKIDEIRKRNILESATFAGRLIGTGRRLLGAFQDLPDEPVALPTTRFAQQRAKDAQQLAELRKDAALDLDKEGTKLGELNQLERARIQFGERSVELGQEDIRHNEAMGVIAAQATAAGIQGTTKAETEEKALNDLTNQRINAKYDALNREYDSQSKIVGIQKELLPVADQSLAILNSRIAYLEDELRLNTQLSADDRTRLGIQKDQLTAAAARLEYETNFQRAQAVTRATAGTEALGLQLGGQPRQAELLQFRTGLEGQAAQARLEGNIPLATELSKQEELGTFGRQESAYFDFRRNPAAVIQQQLGAEEAARQFGRARADYFDRKARGAYGQSRFEAQLFETPQVPGGEKPGVGGGPNDVSVNVRHIKEFLDRNLAVK